MDEKSKSEGSWHDVGFWFWLALLLVGMLFVYTSGAWEIINLDNLSEYSHQLKSYGLLAPILYILLCIGGCLILLPSIPIYLLGGFVFGPWQGILYSTLGSNLGALLAFLLARYAARPLVEKWISGKKNLQRLDEGVCKQGWKMVMVTRLVPLVPFNLQNFAYGLTPISPSTYILASIIFRLPLIAALTLAGSSVIMVREDLEKTMVFLGISLFILLTLIIAAAALHNRLK